MTQAPNRLSVLALLALSVVFGVRPDETDRSRAGESSAAGPPPAKTDPALGGSAIAAVFDANGGKPPATGKELWAALTKVGAFAQLPVVFSAVRLNSGLGAPRVVIAPGVNLWGDAGPTRPNLDGRLFLAANMEKGAGDADPWVATVEFISWNALRQKFDFGAIENMGTDEPRVRVVDGGRCFSCHKNRGPILGAGPWSNSTHLDETRILVANRFGLVEALPRPPVGGAGAGAVARRDRIDGMALVTPQAAAVDGAVRVGGLLALKRDTVRLMTRSPGGRKALEALLVAVAQPGSLDPMDRPTRVALDQWGNDPSYLRFTSDWIALAKGTNTGILYDYVSDSIDLPWRTPVDPEMASADAASGGGTGSGGGYGGGKGGSTPQARAAAQALSARDTAAMVAATRERTLASIADYDARRSRGRAGLPSSAQPSNPSAFVPPQVKATQRPSGMVNSLMLAVTIGLTEGDRKFLATALADASQRVANPKVTAATLAKEVFTGPEFADLLGGGPLPDRDEFKDRFVAGLNAVLTTRYRLSDGYAPERGTYASGPRRGPKDAEELELAVVPTSACLRCHDVRTGTKEKAFDPIPALGFDPLDKQARTNWARGATAKTKEQVLGRLQKRLFTDADMPPQDAPESKLFRGDEAAASELKKFLEDELKPAKKP
jgi:hypothetical protein